MFQEKTRSRKKTRRHVPHRSKRLPRGPGGGIQLLLIQSVESLGKQGEIVEVRPGYAQNFLIPQGLATIVTDHHRRMVEKHRARLHEIENARMSQLRDLANELSKQSVTIEANANEDGQLYGSVNQNDISRSLVEADFEVTPEQIILSGVLKELGMYTVHVQLHEHVESEMKVWVVPSADEEEEE